MTYITVLAIVLFAAFEWSRAKLFLKARQKEEARLANAASYTVMASRALRVYAFVVGLAFLLGAVGSFLAGRFLYLSASAQWNTVAVYCAVIGGYAFLTYCLDRFSYLTVTEEGILKKEWFGKGKAISYSEIAYFSIATAPSLTLTAYDKNGIPLFRVKQNEVGIDNLVSLFTQREIPTVTEPFPDEALKASSPYKRYQAIEKMKTRKWCFLGIGALVLLIPILLLTYDFYIPFENAEVTGVLASVEKEDDSVFITLQDDDAIYYINTVVYSALDDRFLTRSLIGEEAILTVAYEDGQNYTHLSGVSVSGWVYLDPAEAKAVSDENDSEMILLGWMLLALSAALLAAGIVFAVKQAKQKREDCSWRQRN